MIPWCAICRFPGKEPFILGTVAMGRNAMQHEICGAVDELADRLFPTRPVLEKLIPGQLVFEGNDDEAAAS